VGRRSLLSGFRESLEAASAAADANYLAANLEAAANEALPSHEGAELRR
jgi:hypothetical protein